MRNFISQKTLRRVVHGALAALALGFGVSLLALPAEAGWHHGGTNVVIGLGFYAPPPVYYAPAPAYYYPAPPPVVVQPAPVIVQQYQPACQNGDWRQDDGSIVSGTACLQPDGTWRLAD
jgi:hypothetical protein